MLCSYMIALYLLVFIYNVAIETKTLGFAYLLVFTYYMGIDTLTLWGSP